jgi:hypothetical protein
MIYLPGSQEIRPQLLKLLTSNKEAASVLITEAALFLQALKSA